MAAPPLPPPPSAACAATKGCRASSSSAPSASGGCSTGTVRFRNMHDRQQRSSTCTCMDVLPAIASVLPLFNRPSPGRPAGRFLNLACVVSCLCAYVTNLRSCRYCSAEYPRMAAYSVCNWCLTTDKQVGGGSPPPPPPAPAPAKSLTTMAKRRASSRQLNGSRGGHHGDVDPYSGGGGSAGCSRSAFPAEPQKPVKKPKKSHEGAAAGKGREEVPTGARTKPPFTAKARVPRYKLLAEVIR